ncbi:MAG: crotonobetainyl-CoA:carnitine CoA-transferase CaiB-like acyl-CoA transferase, partial [Porticoccaceae bacterium]
SVLLPLQGVRVLELCWVWSGPLLGQLLADLGAEVIKVEWYKRFDLYRTRGVERLTGQVPEKLRREMSQSFHGLNRNKIGVTLDLKQVAHKDAFLDLVEVSDLVIENFTYGTIERLGIGYEVLSKINPSIVLLSLSAYGGTSRLAEMRSYGLALSSLSGVEHLIVDPETEEFLGSPTFVSSDPNAASYGLQAAMAGLLDARNLGRGSHIEMSQLEAAAHLAVDENDDLRALASSLGIAEDCHDDETRIVETGDDQYLCVASKNGLSAEAMDRICNLIPTLAAENAISMCVKAGAYAVKVIEKPEEFGTGSAQQGTLLPSVHPITGSENIVAAPWRINGCRAPLRKTAPTLGEGNSYVLSVILDWSPEECNSLKDPF